MLVIDNSYTCYHTHTLLLLHPFNGLFSRVNQFQKGKTILDFNEARDDGLAVASAGPYANYLHFAPDI